MTAESFVALTLLMAVGTVLVMVVAGGLAACAQRQLGPPPGPEPARLDRYQLAYLSGGSQRVAGTALVTMTATSEPSIRISRGGRVRRAIAGVSAPEPMERAVTEALPAGITSWVHVGQLRTAVGESEAVRQLHQCLIDAGLLATPSMQRRVRPWLAVTRMAATGAALAWLLACIAATVVVVAIPDVGLFVLVVTVGVGSAMAAFYGLRWTNKQAQDLCFAPTRTGAAALQAATQATPRELAIRLALEGVHNLPDREMKISLSQQEPVAGTPAQVAFAGADRVAEEGSPPRDLHRPETGHLLVGRASAGSLAPVHRGKELVAMLQVHDLANGPAGWDILDRDENVVARVDGTTERGNPVQLVSPTGEPLLTQPKRLRFRLPNGMELRVLTGRVRRLPVRDESGQTVATITKLGPIDAPGGYALALHQPVLSMVQAAGMAQLVRNYSLRAQEQARQLR